MKRVLMVMLGALLLMQGNAYAQQKVVHRNIGLDSLLSLMQRNCNEKIYCQKGDDAGKLVFTVDEGSATVLDDIKGMLADNGFSVVGVLLGDCRFKFLHSAVLQGFVKRFAPQLCGGAFLGGHVGGFCASFGIQHEASGANRLVLVVGNVILGSR